MKNLLKNNLRYLLKNKVAFAAIFVLLSIAIMVFCAFTNLSMNINKVYNNLTKNYNLHNIVINEMYSQDEQKAEQQKLEMQAGLKALDVEYRPFNSININNPSNEEIVKVIEYVATYSIDRLDVFQQHGLPKNPVYGNYVLPNSIDFEAIINLASQNLDSSTATAENIFARQKLIYFFSRSNFKPVSFQNEFDDVWSIIKSNPNYDPINHKNSSNNSQLKVSEYLSALLDPQDSKYTPIVVRGSRMTINLTEFNAGVPATGYFEDPYGYLAIVSNGYMQANNKEYFSFVDFQKSILVNKNDSINESDLDLLPSNISDFPNIKSTLEINNWLDLVDDKFKIYVNNIPYLIVGSGITPDFIYPVLSFANTIPNPSKEALLYTNTSGYKRTETSFASAPHESFLLAKYNGSLSQAEILNEINMLTRKSMSWPANITAAYWYNDVNNKLSPTALRIEFINSVITTFLVVVITLTIFVLLLTTFVVVLFVKKFIGQNRTNIAICISNGINKIKFLYSLTFITTFICLVSGPVGYAIGQVLEHKIFEFLANYWFLPTAVGNFSILWLLLVTIVPIILFMVLIFGVGYLFLRENLVNLLKQNSELKVSKPYLGFRKLIVNANVMYKFRSSLVFNSLSKISFITVLSTLTIASMTFATSATSKLSRAYELESYTNKSTYSIDLFTPTSQGGQYFGTKIQDTGHQLMGKDDTVNLTDVGYQNGMYSALYASSPIFRNYSSLFWASANDSTLQKDDILYTKNKVANQVMLNYSFGLGTLSTNPWNISKSLMPVNQMNASIDLSIKLLQKMLSDIRPYNQAFFDNLNKIQPLIPSETINANVFPSEWVIQNFNMQDNADKWNLVYLDENKFPDENVGVINASEIFDDNTMQLKWLAPENVIEDQNNLAEILNHAYNTYGTSYKSEETISALGTKLYPKLYGELFTQDAISNLRIKNGNVYFSVDVNSNVHKSLITTRSILMKQFMKRVELTNDNVSELNSGNIILDPLDYNSITLKKYGYELINVVETIKLNNEFVKLITHVYNDPAYTNLFYRALNNYTILDDNVDEPYVYVNGTIQSNGENIKIVGIKQESKFIELYDNNQQLINDKLYVNSDNIPLIINRYVAKKYNLKVGDVLDIVANNDVYRYEYEDVSGRDVLLSDDLNFNTKSGVSKKYEIVGINNTGNNQQFYIGLEQAQKVLGLATASDYQKDTNTTQLNNDKLVVGMNNQYNSLGGFNGVFTSESSPVMLTSTVGVYSPSGLYPGNDSWVTSNEIVKLIINTLKSNRPYRLAYLASALQVSVSELNSIKSSLTTGLNPITEEQFAKRIINVLSKKYDGMIFVTIYENADSLLQQQVMFRQLSNTFDDILIGITTLLICLSLIIIGIIATMVIDDLLKITAILTTLGYSNYQNALSFFAIFAPAWLISIIISGPISLLLNKLMEWFTFNNIALFITVPFNWIAFILVSLGVTGIFALVFIWGLRWFKKNNLLDALKW